MLKTTALNAAHRAMGAKMVDFSGWDMPVHYGSQIEEHHRVRRDAGMFDVSHMLAIDFLGEGARDYLRRLLANNVDRLQIPGKAMYSCMLNEQGGVIDDLIVYFMREDWFRIVVNAGTCDKDLAWMQKQRDAFAPNIEIKPRRDFSIVAVQGPNARDRVWLAAPELHAATEMLKPFQAAESGAFFVGRTGYTGEDGFEIILPSDRAEGFWKALHAVGVAPIGLGARDTLRLEAGMCLYGNDIDDTTTPVSAAIGWAVAAARRAGGARAGGFPGAAVVLGEFQEPPARVRVGLLPDGRAPQRAGTKLLGADGREVGVITSGNHSPTLGRPVAMGYLDRAVKLSGEALHIDSRGQSVSVSLTSMPFVPNRYQR